MDVLKEPVALGRLRENVWRLQPEKDSSYFQTTDGIFEVPTAQAQEFLKLRPYFSGNATPDDIASRSGVSRERVVEIANSLAEAQLFQEPPAALEEREMRNKLQAVMRIWAGELKDLYIANKLLTGPYTKNVLVGWLLEMFHYIRGFPAAIQEAADNCVNPQTKAIIQHYANQEKGHEDFVVQTLENLGLKQAEIRESHPLPSTQLVLFLMSRLLRQAPTMVFAMALLVESQEFDDTNVELFKRQLADKYSLPPDALGPYFLHQKIDTEMGHGRLMDKYLDDIEVADLRKVDAALNMLHDLKHAFELQSSEIVSYYGGDLQGRYVPRQAMVFAAL